MLGGKFGLTRALRVSMRNRLRSSRGTFRGTYSSCGIRMSSGTYMPPPVKTVQIPKKHGRGVRTLGVPTVADRVAQTVAKLYLEPEVEPVFHQDSYGYRPGRSALDAVRVCRKRCWKIGLGDRPRLRSLSSTRLITSSC